MLGPASESQVSPVQRISNAGLKPNREIAEKSLFQELKLAKRHRLLNSEPQDYDQPLPAKSRALALELSKINSKSPL